MSGILLRWLNEEIGLSTVRYIGDLEQLTIVQAVTDFEVDLCNGFLLGELCSKHSFQSDFKSFVDSDRLEAKLNNFTRLEPTLKRLGIKFGSRSANEIMTQKIGAASKLLLQLKSAFQIAERASKAGISTGTIATTLTRYDQIEREIFTDRLHQETPRSETTRKVKIDTMWMEERAEEARAAAVEQQKYMEMAGNRRSEMLRKRKEQKLATEQFQDRMKTSHQRSKQVIAEMESVKKRAVDRERKKKEDKRNKERDEGRMEVTGGISDFERNLKRIATSDLAAQPEEEATSAPATTTTTTSDFQALNAVEHVRQLESRLPSAQKGLSDAAEYLASVRVRKEEDDTGKREREKRRRKVALEQQLAQNKMEERKREVSVLRTLMQLSQEERQMAMAALEVRREKEEMRENRIYREEQYKARRDKDFEAALARNAAIAAAERQAYEEELVRDADRVREAQQARASTKKNKHDQMCRRILMNVVDLATKVSEARWANDQSGLLDASRMRDWAVLFVSGVDAKWDDAENAATALSHVVLPSSSQPSDEEVSHAEAVQAILDEAAVKDYVRGEGNWHDDEAITAANEARGCEDVGFTNPSMINLLTAVKLVADPPLPPPPPPSIPTYPVRVCVVGAPMSGKTVIARSIAEQYQLALLTPEVLVKDAIEAAEQAAGGPDALMKQLGELVPSTSRKDKKNKTKTAQFEEGMDPVVWWGRECAKCLKAGRSVEDDLVVALIVCAIKGLDKKAGWVVDGFPHTTKQAALLDRELTGSPEAIKYLKDLQASVTSPPHKGGKERKGRHSLVPSTQDSRKDKEKDATYSGTDAVIHLSLDSMEIAHRRGAGRRVDIETGRIYHIEYDPPAPHTGVFERLERIEDADHASDHVHERWTAWSNNESGLLDWHQNQHKLHGIDATKPVSSVIESVYTAIETVLEGKEEEEPPTPVVQSDEPEKTRGFDMLKAEGGLLGNALESCLSLPPANLESTFKSLDEFWRVIEDDYFAGLVTIVHGLNAERAAAASRFCSVRRAFTAFIHRPDDKQNLLEAFQSDVNDSITMDMRGDPDVKAELHQRVDDFQEQLWSLCDDKRDGDEAEIMAILDDGWTDDHATVIAKLIAGMIQMELDRCCGVRQVIVDAYNCLVGRTPITTDVIGVELLGPIEDEKEEKEEEKKEETKEESKSHSPRKKSEKDSDKKGHGAVSRSTSSTANSRVSVPTLTRKTTVSHAPVETKGKGRKGGAAAPVADTAAGPLRKEHGNIIQYLKELLTFAGDYVTQIAQHIPTLSPKLEDEIPEPVIATDDTPQPTATTTSTSHQVQSRRDKRREEREKREKDEKDKEATDEREETEEEKEAAAAALAQRQKEEEERAAAMAKRQHCIDIANKLDENRRACLEVETKLTIARLESTIRQGIALINDLYRRTDGLHAKLDSEMGEYYLSSMRTVAAIATHMKETIEKNQKLVFELCFDGEDALLNEEVAVVVPEPPPRPPTPDEKPPSNKTTFFAIPQLIALCNELKQLAPKGIVPIDSVVSIIKRAAGSGLIPPQPPAHTPAHSLPTAWIRAISNDETSFFNAFIDAFDGGKVGYVDWRMIILNLACEPSGQGSATPLPTTAQVLDLLRQVQTVDDGEGVSLSEWEEIDTWLDVLSRGIEEEHGDDEPEEHTAVFGEPIPPKPAHYNRPRALKTLLFDIFCDDDDKLVGNELALCLCLDQDALTGLHQAATVLGCGAGGFTLSEWHRLLHTGPYRIDSAHPHPDMSLNKDPAPKDRLQRVFHSLAVPFSDKVSWEDFYGTTMGKELLDASNVFKWHDIGLE